MSEENLVGFAEGVLLLHEKLRKYVKQSDLFHEINLLLHGAMDVTVKRFSMDHKSTFSKNSVMKGNRNSLKSKTACFTLNTSGSENGVSDFRFIKPCFVKLDKIRDSELSKHLAKKLCTDKNQSDSSSLEFSSLKSIKMTHNPTKFLGSDKNVDTNVNINIDPKFLATEDHLNLLMAREMRSSFLQMEKRLNGRGRCAPTKNVKNCHLKPVVLLKRLSPQFISQAINGKLEMESHEYSLKRKQRVPSLSRMTSTSGLRRSERLSSCSVKLSNISLLTEGLGSSFCSRRSSSLRSQCKTKDTKVTLFGNKENTVRPRKRASERIDDSDDEEAFYGFEKENKNRHRINKMKEALKTLNAEPLGKENDSTAILNRDIKSFLRNKVPLKAVNRNRIEAQSSTSGDISKDPIIENFYLSIRNNHLNDVETKKKFMISRNNAQDDETPSTDFLTQNRMEILNLFKKREKALINKMVRDQRKLIVSKTGELLNEDQLLNEPLNYYSNKYYFKRTGRRIPLWAEESIRNVIIELQDQIPTDVIVGYFQDDNPFASDPTSIAAFLGNAFSEKDEKIVKRR